MKVSSSKPASKRTAVLAGAAVVMLVAGALVVRCTTESPTDPDRAESAHAVRPGTTVPASVADQPGDASRGPIEVTADKRGAIAAGVAYATASQRWLYLTDDEVRDAVAEIATPVAVERLAEKAVADVSMARDQLAQSSGRIWWLVRPLAWRVDDFRDTEARISVWTVTILSAAEVAAPQSEFLTVTFDLTWVDGDWRVDGARDTPGPTPISGPQDQPWDAEPFDEALDGFTRMEGEPVS